MMRNILITAMMLIAVAVLFLNVIGGNDGMKAQIQVKGEAANAQIGALNVP